MKVQFGDIVEIKTRNGLAYAIYTHKHERPPKFGAVIRVFDHLCQSRPHNILEILKNPIRFTTFFPLQAAVDKGILEVIGNVSIPKKLRPFPIFRDGVADPKTKKVATWWLWDGEKEWQIGRLTPDQRNLPIRSVWNDTFLIHRIEEGWRPNDDPR
jgi:hypothetical protein